MAGRFLHAADVHLDSPLQSLAAKNRDLVEVVAKAGRAALTSVVDAAIENQVQAVLLAGDNFDGDWRDYATGLCFSAALRRLHEADIPVVLIHGNHDAASVVSKQLTLPGNVTSLSVDHPETWLDESRGLAVHGQGFATRAMPENLAARYPVALGGLLNVGLLHTSLDGRPGHDPYAPCTLADLQAKAYDYWALGHVHAYEEVCAQPWVVYPGNIQGRHTREAGPKGCVLVDYDDCGVTSVKRHVVDSVRWGTVRVDASQASDLMDVLPLVMAAFRAAVDEASRPIMALRVEIATPAGSNPWLWRDSHRVAAEVQQVAEDVGGVIVERVKAIAEESDAQFMTQGGTGSASAQTDELLGPLLQNLRDAEREHPAPTLDLKPAVLQACRRGGFDLDDGDQARDIARQAADLLQAMCPSQAGHP